LRLLLHSSTDPAFDLALDEAIHTGLEEGTSPPTWRLWQASAPTLVLGTGQIATRELDFDAAQAHKAPILRRHSGGGAVLIGPGVINYSAFYRIADLPGAETITGAMRAALQPLLAVLELRGLKTSLAGLSDVVVKSPDGLVRKIAGNAQARKRIALVVHGSLLASPDWELLEQLLRFPSRPPIYRAGRSHRDFLTSLEQLNVPHDLASMAQALAGELGAQDIPPEPNATELGMAMTLLAEKYALPSWTLRR
jgi:lipoate-protein ligase A